MKNLQHFDNDLLTSLESLYLLLDILHDPCLCLQYVQECLALIRLSHLLGEAKPLILQLQQLLVILQLLQFLAQFLLSQDFLLLRGIKLLNLRRRLALILVALELTNQVGTQWVHNRVPWLHIASLSTLHHCIDLGLIRQWLKKLDVYVNVHLTARVVLALEVQDCLHRRVADLVCVFAQIEFDVTHWFLVVLENQLKD